MENNIETSRALATRIYDLDSEVYRLGFADMDQQELYEIRLE